MKGINKVNKLTRTVISLSINCFLALTAYYVSEWVTSATPSAGIIMIVTSYILLAAGMFFGWWFNRGRVFFCSMMLFFCQLFLVNYAPEGLDRIKYYNMMLTMLSVYIPLNILVFSVQKERGVMSPWGKMRLLFIIAEVLVGAWIIWYNDTDLLQLFEMKLFPVETEFLPGFPHLSLLLYGTALAYLFIRQTATGKNQDALFMGITVFSFAALLLSKDADAAAIMFAVPGLMLIASVMKTSYSMAYLDELTGLPSRRALKEEMLKLGGKYTIAMLDIDHFKKFNDTHGHDVGDDVLRLVATCIKNAGGGGKAYRYGGEEFTILFPGKDREEVIPHLEELREYIANRGFVKRSKNRPKEKPAEIVTKSGSYKKLYLTVSIGVAERNDKLRTAEEVLKAADKALYRAKSKGRNCVCK